MNQEKNYIAFDQFQRYQTFANLIECHRQKNAEKKFQILELGSNEHKDLGMFLENDNILYTDIVLTEAMEKDPAFQCADGTDLPFEDQSFDFVVAADVFEHVPQEKRAQFLSEAYRVSRIGVILSFPIGSPEVASAEDRLNAYFKTISGQDFIWLKEHSENGLPDIDWVKETLIQLNIPQFSFTHGDLNTWEKMFYCHFNTVFTPETVEYRTKIDNYYNSNIYGNDVSDCCYRIFFVLCRTDVAEWSEYANNMWKKDVSSTNAHLDALLQAHSNIHPLFEHGTLCAQLGAKDVHIGNLNRIIEDKDRHISNLDHIIEDCKQSLVVQQQQAEEKEASLLNLSQQLIEKENEYIEMKAELDHYKLHYQAAINQRTELQAQVAEWQGSYAAVVNSRSWKLTKPYRAVGAVLKRLIKSNKYTHLIAKGIKSILRDGVKSTWRKVKRKLRNQQNFQNARTPIYSEEELLQQKSYVFSKNIKFSILVPLYNTPEKYLREMIQSVLDQTYGNWELCLADGSDAQHGNVGRICKQYAHKDSRVRYQKLEKNLGISGNTNACIDMATGDFISLFDHDDLLHPAALFAKMKAICEQDADFIYTDENTFHNTPADAFCPHFKPDYAPDTLRANNYICHFTSFKRSLLEQVGKFRPECDGSQDFDMMLRLTEKAEKIVHIPQILYYWRAHPNSVADSVGAKPYVIEAAKRAISDHLERVGLKGEVLDSAVPSMYRLKYEIKGEPLVSIIIPNYEHKAELKVCLDSIYAKSTYSNFEIIIVENNSKSQEIFEYYDEIQKKWDNVKVVVWDKHFNYSAINNFGAQFASGEHLLLLNNDTEVISPDWIQEMLMYSQRSDVGAVGAKLYYPDNTIQHAGLGLGLLSLAGHLHRNFDRNHPGYMGRLVYAQNLSGVTAACVMVRKTVWDEIEGLDETFEVAFNDVDMCMRIRKAGYLIVWTPFAELYHYESKSRGAEDTPAKRKRFLGEVDRFQTRWAAELAAGDPYYNPNFSLDKEDFSLREV